VRKAADIILGYNLPFFLWSAIAAIKVFSNNNFHLDCCIIHRISGWCPACGLTSSYANFLQGNGFKDTWFAVVFILFIANFFYSLLKTANILHREK